MGPYSLSCEKTELVTILSISKSADCNCTRPDCDGNNLSKIKDAGPALGLVNTKYPTTKAMTAATRPNTTKTESFGGLCVMTGI